LFSSSLFDILDRTTFVETPVRRWPPGGQSQTQLAAESSVIVVKPELTDEQLADLYMARKTFERRRFPISGLPIRTPESRCI